ncbi:MAG: sugar ABC transporter substrate-binding protein [Clostridium butyricum]|nr:sugar ABC transporter substrate-binding protein [Clostridium butyricum]
MNKRKLLSLFLSGMLATTCLVGCGSTSGSSGSSSSGSTDSDGYKHYSAFFATAGKEVPDNARLKNKIAEKTGVKVDETWLTGQTPKERIGVMVAGGEYPDFIDGGDGTQSLIDAGALIALDEYIDSGKYPNITNYLNKSEWARCKQPDGHIYYIPQFSKVQGKVADTNQNGEAFWIQQAVLEWANYPKITTLDQYFDLIEKYKEANPTIDGKPTIGFEILSYDTKYFCLENPPQFLAGYPNDGKAVIDKNTHEAKLYETLPEAKQYYKKLGEEYKKGIIDPETFTANYDQYISKLSTGAVLGMVDQKWQFENAIKALKQEGKEERTWVPLPLVIDPSVKPHYRTKPDFNGGAGLGITTSCKDVDGALKFINDLLDPEVMILRHWGEKDEDYKVGDDGVFYRTQEQREKNKDQDWVQQNMCPYAYFPDYKGYLADNINTVVPTDQPKEFREELTDTERKVLDAYGYQTYADFMNDPSDEENEPWYPIWSYVNNLTSDSPAKIAYTKMDDIKKQWLPKVIMTDPSGFDSAWDEYTTTLTTQADSKAYLDALTKEVERRIKEFSVK